MSEKTDSTLDRFLIVSAHGWVIGTATSISIDVFYNFPEKVDPFSALIATLVILYVDLFGGAFVAAIVGLSVVSFGSLISSRIANLLFGVLVGLFVSLSMQWWFFAPSLFAGPLGFVYGAASGFSMTRMIDA